MTSTPYDAVSRIDRLEINMANFKEKMSEQHVSIKELSDRVRGCERYIWIAAGIATILQPLIVYFLVLRTNGS